MTEGHHHDLAHEFPEYKDAIHALKESDRHFRTLFERYHEVDKKIARSEARIELMSEIEEESHRKERLKLKDQLLAILGKNNS